MVPTERKGKKNDEDFGEVMTDKRILKMPIHIGPLITLSYHFDMDEGPKLRTSGSEHPDENGEFRVNAFVNETLYASYIVKDAPDAHIAGMTVLLILVERFYGEGVKL